MERLKNDQSKRIILEPGTILCYATMMTGLKEIHPSIKDNSKRVYFTQEVSLENHFFKDHINLYKYIVNGDETIYEDGDKCYYIETNTPLKLIS